MHPMLCLHTLGWWPNQHVETQSLAVHKPAWLTDGLDPPLEMCSFSGKKRPGRGSQEVVCTEYLSAQDLCLPRQAPWGGGGGRR